MYRDPAEPHHETAVAIAHGRIFKLEYTDGRLERADSVEIATLDALYYQDGMLRAVGKRVLSVDMTGEQFAEIFDLVRCDKHRQKALIERMKCEQL